MSKLYINVEDYQSGNWAFGFVGTIKEWQELAISWCESDDNDELLEEIKRHELNNELLDIINDIWTINIIEFKKENIDKIIENYDKDDLKWLLKYLVEKVGK